MIRHGEEPYLECSSAGDKRFSAFYAKVWINGINRSIEEWYQARKVFSDGTRGLHWTSSKGKKPVNLEECIKFYSYLWDLYIQHNPELLDVLVKNPGLSDRYGKLGHCCQATELWRIRNDAIAKKSP